MRPTLLLLCLLTFACPAWAEVIITESIEYYKVDGVRKKEIIHNLKTKSPIIIQGKSYQGHTRAKTKYSFSWEQQGDTCTLKKVTVNLHIIYKLPELRKKPGKHTQAWWDKHMEKLIEHEMVHGKIARQGAQELDRELQSFKQLKCATAKQQIKTLANHIFDQIKMRQVKYDKLTDHGKKQELYTGQSF